MKRTAGRVLGNLFPTTESVGYHDSLRGCLTDGGQKSALRQRLRNFILFPLEAKGSGHATAARVEKGDVRSGTAEQVELGGHFEDGLVVTVAVEDDALSREAGWPVVRRPLGKEIAEEECLLTQSGGASVLGEEVVEFIAEDAGAGRLKKDDGQSGVDFRGKDCKDLLKIMARRGQEAKVVEGASAAEMLAWDADAETGRLKH